LDNILALWQTVRISSLASLANTMDVKLLLFGIYLIELTVSRYQSWVQITVYNHFSVNN